MIGQAVMLSPFVLSSITGQTVVAVCSRAVSLDKQLPLFVSNSIIGQAVMLLLFESSSIIGQAVATLCVEQYH